MYVTRGMGWVGGGLGGVGGGGLTGHSKCFQMRTGGTGFTLHMHVRTYTISFHVFVVWCLVLFVKV